MVVPPVIVTKIVVQLPLVTVRAKTLRALLGNPKEDVTYFNLQRYLKHHYLPMPATQPVAKKVVVVATPPPVAEPAVAPAKKKILVKKRPASSELAEEA